jgi:hypothetical protein
MKRTPFSLFQVAIMALMGGLCVVLKVALRIPLKTPGKTGLYWIALVLVSAGIVNRKGAAVTTGLFGATLAALLSPGKEGPLVAFCAYAALGLGVELGTLIFRQSRTLACCLVAGFLGSWSKLLIKVAADLLMQMPPAVVLAKSGYAAITYTVFGLAGGLLAYLALKGLSGAGLFTYMGERV